MSGSVIATAAPSAPMPDDGHVEARSGLTTPRVIALLLILFPTLVRVLLVNDPFPIWDVNPFKFPAPSVGVPPTLAMALDVMAIVGAAMALIVSGARVRLLEPLLLAVGGVVVAMHALFVDGGSLDNLRIGSCWVSALAAGIGVRALASDPVVRKWVFSLVLACAMPLAIQSLVQVFVEHPATVASYRANPQAFLDAQGWTPGSAMARNYERRLMQPEATGWFGMANVHATFGAAFVIGWLGVVAGPVIEQRLAKGREPKKSTRKSSETSGTDVNPSIRGESLLLGLMLVLAVAMLAMTGSKGGFAACVLGLGMLVAGWAVLPRVIVHFRGRGSPRGARVIELLPPLLGPLVAVGMIGLIAMRGALGTSIGELSLLFRWFYISAATRIFGEQPLLGVGPADFRPAYELAKNPLSPEEVTSPHSVVFDWISMLGVGGVAWTMLLLSWAMALGYGVFAAHRVQSPAQSDAMPITSVPSSSRAAVGWALAIIGLSCVTAFIIELAGYADVLPLGTTLADMSIVISQSRLPGMILWLLAAALLLARPIEGSRLKCVLACVGISLIASACIDVAPVWANSAALFFVMLGLAASEDVASEDRPMRRERATNVVGAAIVLSLATPMMWAGGHIMRWERELVDAGQDARRTGLLSLRLTAINNGAPLPGDSVSRWRLDAQVSSDPTGQAVNEQTLWRLLGPAAFEASAELAQAHEALSGFFEWSQGGDLPLVSGEAKQFSHPSTLIAASDSALSAVDALQRLTPEVRKEIGDPTLQRAGSSAIFLAKVAANLQPPTSSAQGALARAYLHSASVIGSGSLEGEQAMPAAIAAFERAASLDPHGITYPLQLFELARQSGDRELARKWAEELLRRNENMKLDPVRALTPEQVARARAALRPSP